MAEIQVPDSINRYNRLSLHYSQRNEQYRLLRKQYNGDLTSVSKRQSSLSQGQEEQTTVYNLISAGVKRFISNIAATVPQSKAVPRSSAPNELHLANKRTAWLNHVWQSNDLATLIGKMAWYQSLLGSFPLLVNPDQSNISGFKITLGVPEFFYPMPTDDTWTDFDYIVYAYRKYTGKGRADYDVWLDPTRTSFTDTTQNVMMYWDKQRYQLEVNGIVQESVRHNLGFIPWVHGTNMPVPHNQTSEGDFDQSVPMQEYINEQLLLQGKIIFDFANAPIVVSASRSSTLNTGDRVWDLGPDGRAQYLTYPGNSPSQETLFIKSQQGFEDMTMLSSPSMGRDVPSGTTGPVINSLLGGFSGVLAMKQLMIGNALRKANMIIQQMAETLYPKTIFPIYPSLSNKYHENIVVTEPLSIQPLELGGWYQNVIIIPEPDSVKSFKDQMQITKMQLGLQSRLRTMTNLGIDNPEEELKQIMLEQQAMNPQKQPATEPAPEDFSNSPEALEAQEALKSLNINRQTLQPPEEAPKKPEGKK